MDKDLMPIFQAFRQLQEGQMMTLVLFDKRGNESSQPYMRWKKGAPAPEFWAGIGWSFWFEEPEQVDTMNRAYSRIMDYEETPIIPYETPKRPTIEEALTNPNVWRDVRAVLIRGGVDPDSIPPQNPKGII